MSRRSLLGAAAITVIAGGAVTVTILEAEEPAPVISTSTPAAPTSVARCAVRLEAPAPPPEVATLEPVDSVIVAVAKLSTKWLAAQIGERVPTTLASAKRKDIGAPGEVSYVVTRGPLSLSLEDERLWVRTAVGAQAEVCKPIGPICPTYGRCSPRFASSVGVPLMIDALDEGAQISLQTLEGCSIAGFDATSRIETQAKQQVAGVKAKVDALLPSADEREKVVVALGQPWPRKTTKASKGCLRFSPTRLVQAPPKLDDQLTLRFALVGRITAETECEPSTPDIAIERGEVPETGDVAIATLWDWSSLAAALPPLEPLAFSAGSVEAKIVGVRGGQIDGSAKAVLELSLDGAICGPLFVTAEPVVRGDAIAFEQVTLSSDALPREVRTKLVAALETMAIAAPAEALGSRDALMRIDRLLGALVNGRELPADLAITVEGEPARLQALVGAKGLRLIAHRRAQLVARAR